MRQLILIRHSQSQPIPALPQSAWGLTAEGRARCRPLAEQLRPYALQHILTSYETKAQETAALTAAELGVPWQVRAGFEEQGGDPPYLDQEAFSAAVQALFNQPQAMVFGSETGQQAQARFTAAANHVLAEFHSDNVAIVTHGRVLTLFLAHHTPIDSLPFWQSLTMPCFVVLSLNTNLGTMGKPQLIRFATN